MNSRPNFQGGYVGLLVLLISVAIGIFLIGQIFLRPGALVGKDKATSYGLDAIDQAKQVKKLIESR